MKIGVVLTGLPRLLRGILLDILSRQDDFVVISLDDDGDMDLEALARSTDLDVLITADEGVNGAEPPLALLYARPRLTVMRLKTNGRSAAFHSLRPVVEEFADVSPDVIVNRIREAATSAPDPA